jgi:hypothetical protein
LTISFAGDITGLKNSRRDIKMKSHPYEYKILVEYITPQESGRFPHFTRIEDQEGFTRTLEDLFTHLPESVPEGWEVISHNITESRSTLLVTVLLRKPKNFKN